MTALHPILVNLTMFLVPLALAGDLLAFVAKKPAFRRYAGFLLLAGLVTAVLAVITGTLLAGGLANDPPLQELVSRHQLFGQITLALIALFAGVRFYLEKKGRLESGRSWVVILLGLIAIGILFRTGNLGGQVENYQEPHLNQESGKSPTRDSLFEE